MYRALQAAKSVLSDIQQRESKTSFHGQRVSSDCGEGIKVIDQALDKADGHKTTQEIINSDISEKPVSKTGGKTTGA